MEHLVLRARRMTRSFTLCLLLVVACSSSSPSAKPDDDEPQSSAFNEERVVASNSTHDTLGVDRWGISGRDESSTVHVISVVGYDAANAPRARIAFTKVEDAPNAPWIDVLISSQPPARLRLEPNRDAIGLAEFRANAAATKMVDLIEKDLRSAETPTVTTSSLSPQDLVRDVPTVVLTHAHYMVLCLGTGMSYADCNGMYWGDTPGSIAHYNP
jgi:hypothetical protein